MKRAAKAEKQLEYDSRFEELQAENAIRVNRLRGGKPCDADRTVVAGQENNGSESEDENLPKYEAVISSLGSETGNGKKKSRRMSILPRGLRSPSA